MDKLFNNHERIVQELNIKYSDFWLNKCPPNKIIFGGELSTYLELSENDNEVYLKYGKEWYDELTEFAVSNGYIRKHWDGKHPAYFELTEQGILTKYLGGHKQYIEYVKMKTNSYKSQRNILLFTAFISFLTLLGTIYAAWKDKPINIHVSPAPILIQPIQEKPPPQESTQIKAQPKSNRLNPNKGNAKSQRAAPANK